LATLRQIVSLMLTLCLLVGAATVVHAEREGLPDVNVRAYVVIDAATGTVLLEHEAQTPFPMASTTKIMTALLALERGNLHDVVTAGENPYNTGGSTIWLDLGERQTLENLLAAVMLESANDAAVAIAEHLAGTEEAFAGWMNERAWEMGLERTHFVNSHGLHDPDHYTTAHDLATMARVAMQNPAFRHLVTIEQKTIPGFKDNSSRELYNHNQLLGYYEGANGVKNGYTEEALLTNVASARRGDVELIAVVLGAESRVWTYSMALLDYGFSHADRIPVVQTNEAPAGVAAADAAQQSALVAPDPGDSAVQNAATGGALRWWFLALAAGALVAAGLAVRRRGA
jgi:serine-type D-Ala-D-Ala carboxypeptidase (penicillin-binding protein 5/6)